MKRIILQKLPDIEGEVFLLDPESGNRQQVYEYPKEYELNEYDDPEDFSLLMFEKYEKVFRPDGSQNEFKDGGAYMLMQLNGNDLVIQVENEIDNNPNPKWVPVN